MLKDYTAEEVKEELKKLKLGKTAVFRDRYDTETVPIQLDEETLPVILNYLIEELKTAAYEAGEAADIT